MAADSIVGYTFNAENLCLVCAAVAAGVNPDAGLHIPRLIDEAGQAAGIDVSDERSFDSSEWPKVIFESQVEGPEERCGNCNESLVD
ncbi:MAG: hypothetical protein WAV90_00625 [Gordonia amarae]